MNIVGNAPIDLPADPAPDLKNVVLKPSLKTQLADLTCLPNNSCKSIVQKFNINYSTLKGHRNKLNERLCVYAHTCRPRKLDIQSYDELLN